MIDKMKQLIVERFLWTPVFWALIGMGGCASGLYFQSVAGNGLALWFMGLIFFGAAYLEREDQRA